MAPYMFLERAEGVLLRSGWGWVGATLFRSDIGEDPSAMFERWRSDEAAGLYAGTLGDVERHGPWPIANFGLDLFEQVTPETAVAAVQAWVEGAWNVDDGERREHDRGRVGSLVESSIGLLNPAKVYAVSATAESCQSLSDIPFPGVVTGFTEVFGLLADGTGCVVLTATDDV